jgi:hypothetical protein
MAFEQYAPLKLWVQISGSNVLVYAANQSRSIIHVKRIILCGKWTTHELWLYLRRPNFVVSDQIEQGLTYLMYTVSWPAVLKVQAEAEYIEFTGRAISESRP